jgi:uncharacterized protein YdaU (DUF1376 family)
MNKPPAFQFYVRDWRSSPTVRRMTREQKGDFIEMLAASWDQEEPGTLPVDFETAAKICGISVRSFRKFVDSFPELWQIDGGRLANPKLRAQWKELLQRKQKQADAARRTNATFWKRPTVSESVTDRSAPAVASSTAKQRGPLVQLSQDQHASEQLEQVPVYGKKPAPASTVERSADASRRKHIESGIYRKQVAAAFFDATKAGMKPDACVREAIGAGALTLLSNRSHDLGGLSQGTLVNSVWDRIRPSIQGLLGITSFETRRDQVVAVVTRNLTDVATAFLEQRVEAGVA